MPNPSNPSLESIRAGASALMTVVEAVERTAWEVRNATLDTVEAGKRDLERLGDASRSGRRRSLRMTRAALVLGRIVASYRFHVTRAAFVTKRYAERSLDALHVKNARRFRELSEELGGAFLKVGQTLGTRADLLPGVWVKELSTLQDAAPPEDFARLRVVIEQELGGPIDEFFASFDETPIAAASIGQVHRAVTKDGEVVAVKVQRPHVDERVEDDLVLLRHFVEALEPSLPPTDFDTIVDELVRGVKEELDFDLEHERLTLVSAFFSDIPGICAPTPVTELCTRRVLTASFEEGRKITEVLDELAAAREEDPAVDEQISDLLARTFEAWVRQVLELGVFQADPHAGNVLVKADGTIVVLDLGCAQDVLKARRDAYRALLMAFLVNDRDGVVTRLSELGFRTRSGEPDTLVLFAEAFLNELRGMMSGEATTWPTTADLLERAKSLKAQADLDPVETIPGDFVLLARVFGTLGGLFATYRPAGIGPKLVPLLSRALIS
ncbi:MAG: AarF/ABC1/UbiB kinase family protein [Sandaracinus sp.]|nr:AarF/ABC1/UbiB kinase family protein [Sandaracinus sp.]